MQFAKKLPKKIKTFIFLASEHFIRHLFPVQAIIAIYGLNKAPYAIAFDAGKSITKASGMGLSPGNIDFFGK